jgi:protein-tyrosine phosphatase
MRAISWDGFHNARDLGGLPTSDGETTRPLSLIRSGDVRFVTGQGWRQAYQAGVRTLVDLRNDDEVRSASAIPLPPGIRRVQVALDGVEDVALWRYLNEELLNGTPLYYAPFLRSKPERVVSALSAIAGAEPGGVIFHCGAGRDRTGLIALLLLALADVDVEVIADDYELSTEPLRRLFELLGRGQGDLAEVEQALAAKGTTARAALRDLLAELDVPAYLTAAGMPTDDLARLRARLRD